MARNDVLSQLLPTTFRGINFPTIGVETTGGHGIVPHRRVDRNGWRVENTGRNSLSVSLRAPFANTLWRGSSETWGRLFPDIYERVIAALEDRSTGDFQHPIYGTRRMKVTDWREAIDPDFRGGPTLQFSLLESVDEGDSTALSIQSDFGLAASSAAAIDRRVAVAIPPISPLEADGFTSFSDFVRKIQIIRDQASLAASQAVAKIDRVIAQAQNLETIFAPSFPSFRDDVGRFVSSLLRIQVTLATTGATKAFHVVPKVTTLASLATRLRNSPAELMGLNPQLAGSLRVPATTLVRHYARGA